MAVSTTGEIVIGENPDASCLPAGSAPSGAPFTIVSANGGRTFALASTLAGSSRQFNLPPSVAADGAGLGSDGISIETNPSATGHWAVIGRLPLRSGQYLAGLDCVSSTIMILLVNYPNGGGYLMTTTDGGHSWAQVSQPALSGGMVSFSNSTDGVIFGNANGYVTDTGGRVWQGA
jgi:hypothetical protein